MGDQIEISPWAPVSELKAELESLQQKQAAMKAELSQRRKNLMELQKKKRRVSQTQIRRAQARITNAERKRRTRRLILIGSYVDSVSQADQVSMTKLMKGLDEFLERDQDLALFDLAPCTERDQVATNTTTEIIRE